MLRDKINILVCSSLVLSVCLSAAPLDKYYIPPQPAGYTTQTAKPNIDNEFRNKVAGLSPEEREKLKESFRQKRDNASNSKNFNAAAYYQHLIDILNSF